MAHDNKVVMNGISYEYGMFDNCGCSTCQLKQPFTSCEKLHNLLGADACDGSSIIRGKCWKNIEVLARVACT